MPRIPNYVRLNGSESEPLLDDKDQTGGIGGYGEDADFRITKHDKVDSVHHSASAAAQNYHEQEQKQLHDVDISKGSRFGRSVSQRNPGGYVSSSKDLKDDTPPVARSGELRRLVSFRDSSNTPKLALSLSGRWQVHQQQGGAGGQARLERTMSGKWRPSGNDNFTRTTAIASPLRDILASPKSPLRDHLSVSPNRQAPAGQVAASLQRVPSFREKQLQDQEHLQQKVCNGRDHPPAAVCTMHSACNEVRPSSQRFTRLQAETERDSSSPARRARFADDVNGKSSPPRRLQRQPTGRFTDSEKIAKTCGGEKEDSHGKLQKQLTGRFTDGDQNTEFEPRVLPPGPEVSAMVGRTSSGKIVDPQRSFSMREIPSSRTEAQGMSNEAPQQKSSSATVKLRVSFTESVNSKPDRENDPDLQRIHEKEIDIDRPTASAIREARMLNAATQPLRYNYEQPGFVERKSTDGCGPYSSGRFSQNGEKENNGRQPALLRTLSTFSFTDRRRLTKTFTFTRDKPVQSVAVECVSCRKGLGIVVQGLPAGQTSSFCKACKPGLPGAVVGTGEFYFGDKSTSNSSSVKPSGKKKKSMLDYCRKFLGI